MKKTALLLSKFANTKPALKKSTSQELQNPKSLGGLGSFGYPREGAPLSEGMKIKLSKTTTPE